MQEAHQCHQQEEGKDTADDATLTSLGGEGRGGEGTERGGDIEEGGEKISMRLFIDHSREDLLTF